jgi:hypothetical protein
MSSAAFCKMVNYLASIANKDSGHWTFSLLASPYAAIHFFRGT